METQDTLCARSYDGAWMTDIDDTIVESGESPGDDWIEWLASKIRILKKHRIAWIPMSGVAIAKLGPRIIYRLPKDVLSHVLYYGGDGSQKYYYDTAAGSWKEDLSYRRVFTDAQTVAVIGTEEFVTFLTTNPAGKLSSSDAAARCDAALRKLDAGGFSSSAGSFLDEMKVILGQRGFDPAVSETYFRGGSVSWMMLGDTSVDPYKTDHAVKVRMELIAYAERRLEEEGHLKRFGNEGIIIPFHGSRGIKFVMRKNDKERGTRDLIEHSRIPASSILFAGNELFDGGNDNMIRNIEGVTLLSVGEHTDPGPDVVFGGIGIQANNSWMEHVCAALEAGTPWSEVLAHIRNHNKESNR